MAHPKGIDLEQEIKAVELYKNGYSLHNIAKELNVKWYPIWTCLKRNNVDRRTAYHNSRKYKIDETYFEKINTHEKAYFLGFIMADGYVRDNKESQYFVISIQTKDREILDKMKDSMKSEHPIKILKSRDTFQGKYTCQEQVSLKVGSIKMCQDLIKLGCNPRKSLTMDWPNNLPEEFINSFILGYFDGDGSISNTISNGYTKYTLDFTSSGIFIEKLQKFIKDKFDFRPNLTFPKNQYLYGRMVIHNYFNIIQFMEWMYQNVEYLALSRKLDRFRLMKEKKGILFKKFI